MPSKNGSTLNPELEATTADHIRIEHVYSVLLIKRL